MKRAYRTTDQLLSLIHRAKIENKCAFFVVRWRGAVPHIRHILKFLQERKIVSTVCWEAEDRVVVDEVHLTLLFTQTTKAPDIVGRRGTYTIDHDAQRITPTELWEELERMEKLSQ